MQYLGGKAGRPGREIAARCSELLAPGALFVDMFCGSLNVVRHVRGPRLAVDASEPLITMWRAALQGWVPPRVVSREEYMRRKDNPDPSDPMTAFVLFGCSFGGKWRGGYAADIPEHRYAECASNAIVAKVADCAGLALRCATFESCEPGCWSPGTVLYCDPPYRATTGYGCIGRFDSERFWTWAEAHRARGVNVFVSESEGETRAGWVRVATQARTQAGGLTPGKVRSAHGLFYAPAVDLLRRMCAEK